MYATIALLSKPFSSLTYSLPDAFPDAFWRPALRVAAPLGKNPQAGLRAGVILETSLIPRLPAGTICKEICWPLEAEPVLQPGLLSLAFDLALRQGVTPGTVLGHTLPAGLRSTAVKLKWPQEWGLKELKLAETKALPRESRLRLARALMNGKAFWGQARRNEASQEFCVLRIDPPWPLRPAAKKRLEILDYLYGNGAVSRGHLLKSLGPSSRKPLEALLAANFVSIERDYGAAACEAGLQPPPSGPFELNEAQKAALDNLNAALRGGRAQSRLLYGVTGSGKTAVYMEVAKLCLALGQSAILLAPEVALAHKLFNDAVKALPQATVFIYHGYQPPARRETIFRTLAARKEPCIVVGTRSALFLPVSRLACIVLDEEHDASFKQDEQFAYSAKEVAWFRMRQTNGLLLLGSATPDIRTFHASRDGKLPMLRLPQRVGGRELPPVELVDIGPGSEAARAAGQGILAPASEKALLACLDKGEQAVVLLNRRGYAPLLYCLGCGKTLRCPNCEIGLNYHKGLQKLVCHYCGYAVPYPTPCPTCGSVNYLAMGEGTERVAERLESIAGQSVLRLDRDNVRRPGRLEEILAAFARRESPFLVGTQMLSKGHHFPNVTLAIVADGDIGLNLPDYRAAERTFQLIVQSAGRAGRGAKAGKVLLQTRDPNHYCWRYAAAYDYEGFYAEELARRQKRLYPPFTNLALLRISFEMGDEKGALAVNELALALRDKASQLQVNILGPAPAPIALLRGRKRFHCLLKSSQWQALRQMHFFAQGLKASSRLRLFLDLDPVNML